VSLRGINDRGINDWGINDAIQIDAIQNDVIQNDIIPNDAIQNDVIQIERIPNDVNQSLKTQQKSIENESFHLSQIQPNPPVRLPKSISSFIAGFKSSVNTKIDDYIDEHQLNIPKYNRNNHFFQPNYHDHIIRNEMEYQNISNYIKNNPFNWKNDKFNGTINQQ
jgi:hypothetical protein